MIYYHNTKAIVICHGKSELILCSSIKSNLRLPIELLSLDNGNHSIQITSLKKFLDSKKLKNKRTIHANYPNIIYEKGEFKNFKIFIVMDVDEKELTTEMIREYQSKEMFKKYDFYDYIVPVFNDPNLDIVLEKMGYKIDKKNKVKSYKDIFPGANGNYNSFKKLLDQFNNIRQSNMIELFEYLDKCVVKYNK